MFHQADRVLEEHDGVVHQEADGQRERHQRQIVEAIAQHRHHDERQQQRKRQRHRGDQRVPPPAQKQEYHHHHQRERDAQRGLHVLRAVHNRHRPVVNRHDVNRPGELRADDGHLIAHGLGYLHRIRSRPAEHGYDRRCRRHVMPPHPESHVNAFVLHAVRCRRDVSQIDRGAVVLSHDQIVILFRIAQLPLRLEQESLVFPVELSRARIARAVLDGARKIINRQVARSHGRWIGLDSHSRLRAVHRNLAHTR